MKSFADFIQERTTFKTFFISSLCILTGLLLIIIAELYLTKLYTLKLILSQLGTLLSVTLSLTLIWELFIKNLFLNEILEKMNISVNISKAGVVDITNDFFKLNWEQYFNNAQEIDLLFSYAHSWRGSHTQDFYKLNNSQIRVILPDYNESHILNELSIRFNMTQENLKENIKDAERFFINLSNSTNNNIKIYMLKIPILFTYYRFGKIGIITTYSHLRQRKAPIPIFVFEKNGFLFDLFANEYNNLIQDSNLTRELEF